MKVLKISYWLSTALFSLMMAFSAYAYVTQPEVKQGFVHLGFPDYFRIELAVAKLLGAVILLAPVATRFKEWAYAGFGIVVISAFIAHIAAGDPLSMRLGPVFALALLLASYFTHYKKQQPAGILN